jgi:hypothetical protein
MEFLDYIKEDYMVLRRCISQQLIDKSNDLTNIFRYQKPINHYKKLIKYYKVYKSTFYWKEIADLDFELTKINLKIDCDLDMSTYEIFNTNLFNEFKKDIMSEHKYIILYYYTSVFMDRLEIYTYDYDKIREAKEELNKEILLESQKRLCDPRFINPEWDDLEKEIISESGEYFDNH